MAPKTRLLLGVSGGIAAYKAVHLVSLAVKANFDVRVVMTPSATSFVGPITFEAMSGNPVMVETLETGGTLEEASAVRHISWAKWAHIACIAPLTAASMAKLTHGIADNALTTVWLALPPETPNLLCPAMNTQMWNHPATQRNLKLLQECARFQIMDPVSKRLACGDVGVGGLPEPEDILATLLSSLR